MRSLDADALVLSAMTVLAYAQLEGGVKEVSACVKGRARIKAIDRRYELNQMDSTALKQVYAGFGLDPRQVERSAAQIDSLVGARNEVAHHGAMPKIASTILEGQVRENVMIVENVLTDFALQLLPFFSKRMHTRTPSGP